jgi:hypothetical protein
VGTASMNRDGPNPGTVAQLLFTRVAAREGGGPLYLRIESGRA